MVVPKNWCCWTVVLEKSLESPLNCKEIKPLDSKGNQCWIFIERTDAEAEVPILWPPDAKNWLIGKDPGGERLKTWGEADDRGWDGWMASPTRWTWVWASSGSWWRTGKPGVLQSIGSQRVRHNWATEPTDWNCLKTCSLACPQVLDEDLAHSRHSINMSWLDHWINWINLHILVKKTITRHYYYLKCFI